MDIKLRVKELLRLSDKKVEDLAEFIEVQRESLYTIIDREKIKRHYKIAIAAFFGMTLDEFLDPSVVPGKKQDKSTDPEVDRLKDDNLETSKLLITMLKQRVADLEAELQNVKKSYQIKKT